MLSVVSNVLITGFGNLNIETFFSGLVSVAVLISSLAMLPVASSNCTSSLALLLFASVPFKTTLPLKPAVVSKTKSAVKSCPLSESSMNICLASAKECVTIFDTVKSALAAFSIINPVSAESDAIIFSPELNVPITCVRTICVPEVNEPKTNPVAPDVLPVIFTPPFVLLAISVGLGMSFKVKYVNGLISNKNNL